MTQPQFDLVLLGATGYTGRLALAYLAGLPEAGRGRVGVAGRDPARVRSACEAVGLEATVLQADACDPPSLATLTARTNTLIHLGGPYKERGPEVVAACVAHGTNYLDLTGETRFVNDMIVRHHDQARTAGIRIIHCSGYESLPFDLTTRFAVEALHTRHGVDCQLVELSLQMLVHDRAVARDTSFSGGTTNTMLVLIDQTPGADFGDPAVLLPPNIDPAPVRARHPPARGARWDPLTNAWATPMYPAPTINPQVILRTAALLADADVGYGAGFTYRESATLAGLVKGPTQRLVAIGTSAMIGAAMRVFEGRSRWQRRALTSVVHRLGAKPGQGPKPELLDKLDYRVRARATGPDGQAVTVMWDGRGNPGYASTAKMLVQAGLALAHDTPEGPVRCGVVTPAAGLGLGFVRRLPAADITLSEC